MGKTEIVIFIILSSILAVVFFVGIIVFIAQYRKRKMLYEKEIIESERRHQLDLLNTQLNSQQQTMQHIGREIHDNVGQKLTLASLYAKQIDSSNDFPWQKKVKEIGAIIDESLAELRQLSKSLTNPEQAEATLYKLLYAEAERINLSGVCFISVSGNGRDVRLPPEKKNILFRILQEFVQNSLKHASCLNISITINKEANTLLIDAADDGKGFDTALAVSGIGLQNMRRRAEELNAVYRLDSSPGNPTSLSLQIKLQ